MPSERRLSHSCRSARPARLALLLGAALAGLTGVTCLADLPDNAVTLEQVVRGRVLVLHHNCVVPANARNQGQLIRQATNDRCTCCQFQRYLAYNLRR